ncbi:MAG: hypothetical protein Q7K65_05840 [Candidatus Buchananbacteria bacterium]|nr:hypothetical protein [Candidatus Buchananbacteria bacterium]
MGFRYIFQFMAMLVGPLVTFASVYVILFLGDLLVGLLIIFFYCKNLDMWDPWRPKVIKQFLTNAKKLGW